MAISRAYGSIADFETSKGRAANREALRKRFAGAKPSDAVQRSLDKLGEVSASKRQDI